METTNEMENMRMQLAALKNKLDKQTIINDRMIREAMKDKSHWIKCKYRALIILCFVMVPYYIIVMGNIGFSLWFCVVASLFMMVAGLYTYYNLRTINCGLDACDNLVDSGMRMAKAKKRDSDWLKYASPLMIPWLAWFSFEAYGITNDYVMLAIGLFGGVLGGTIGLMLHMKMQRKYKEIIEYIEEIEKG